MKFGKEFVSQMVPEWQEAYMDYEFLKTLLKDIQGFVFRNMPPPPSSSSHHVSTTSLKRKLTLYRAFSGLTRSPRGSSSVAATTDIENHPILVTSSSGGGEEGCKTIFLRAEDEGGEYEMAYFQRLDDEFNKALKFYKVKVEEVLKEAKLLNKQMDALIAFRIKVDHGRWSEDSSVSAEISRLSSGIAASTASLSMSKPSSAARNISRRGSMEVIDEDGPSSQGQSDDSSDDKDVKESKSSINNQNATDKQKPKNFKANRPAPLEILDHVKMNNNPETPRSAIKVFLNVHDAKEIKFTRENLNKVEEQLKQAFVEFHHKLRLLKSYSFLNLLAFSKIMKKYDKITSRNASKSYLKMVDNSYLGSCDEVTKLMSRVEATFIKHFSNSNRSKGMNILRPKVKKERHRVTFALGFLFGCTVALALGLVLIVRARNILDHEGSDQYMETMFPLYSLFGLIILHLLMYATNIYFWRRYRVNYSFIFGFKEGTELAYREVLLVSFGIALLATAAVLANLDMEMDPVTKDYEAVTELVPLGLLGLFIVVLFCPFNIIYRSSRYFFLTCVFHCICAPLYKVTLPDFFLADQLTSQVQAIRSLEFYICYYGWGDYKRRQNTCRTNDIYTTFTFIVAAIPYWSRLLQCLRRLFEERDVMQAFNGLKYFSTIIAVSMRTAYSLDEGDGLKTIAWIASVNAAMFGTYWDLVVDWGLFQRNSKNLWLRDKLLLPHRSVYYAAMVLNVVLRFAWLQTVLNMRVGSLHRQTVIALVASLEIIRRGMWNFFRLENEHLNNVGKYRAFKSVPLPFNCDEDEEKDD